MLELSGLYSIDMGGIGDGWVEVLGQSLHPDVSDHFRERLFDNLQNLLDINDVAMHNWSQDELIEKREQTIWPRDDMDVISSK